MQLPHNDVAIIGSGFAGLGMAIELGRSGRHDYTVLERSEALGGTWQANHYPGCACDVPTPYYSFSFAPKPDWSRFYAPHDEIRAYLEDCAQRFGVTPRLRLGSEVTGVAWGRVRATLANRHRRRVRIDRPGARRRTRRSLAPGVSGSRRARRVRGPVVSLGRVGPLGRPHRGPGRGRRYRRERDPVRPPRGAPGGPPRRLPAHRSLGPAQARPEDRGRRAMAVPAAPGHAATDARDRVGGPGVDGSRQQRRSATNASARGGGAARDQALDRRSRAARASDTRLRDRVQAPAAGQRLVLDAGQAPRRGGQRSDRARDRARARDRRRRSARGRRDRVSEPGSRPPTPLASSRSRVATAARCPLPGGAGCRRTGARPWPGSRTSSSCPGPTRAPGTPRRCS
jgi:hypothetical protein